MYLIIILQLKHCNKSLLLLIKKTPIYMQSVRDRNFLFARGKNNFFLPCISAGESLTAESSAMASIICNFSGYNKSPS